LKHFFKEEIKMAKYKLPEHWGRYNWIQSVCNNPNHPNYARYGGRGIQCHWSRGQYKEFEHWLLSTLGPRPSPQHCLNRKDKDKDYCPKNLEWALPTRRSRCNTMQNKFAKYRNQSKSLAQWAEDLEIPYHSLRRRIAQGMTIKDIVKVYRNA
jgi:hypothetical protein